MPMYIYVYKNFVRLNTRSCPNKNKEEIDTAVTQLTEDIIEAIQMSTFLVKKQSKQTLPREIQNLIDRKNKTRRTWLKRKKLLQKHCLMIYSRNLKFD